MTWDPNFKTKTSISAGYKRQDKNINKHQAHKSFSVWDMETGKCKRTFRHRHPVLAVALSSEVCISGCEGGRVKVWELSTGQLIKVTSGYGIGDYFMTGYWIGDYFTYC